jgi:Membrane-associated sensor, integral membrane domain
MQDASVGKPGAGTGADDFPIVIATVPANARHYKIAFGGFIILMVVVAIIMPFATIQLPRVEAFIPVIQTVMCIADLLTAALLFAHYRVQPQRALLALAGGFVSSGLFALLQTLAFPGAYGPGAVIGDDRNSAGWLFVFWHTVFPLAVIVYALWKDEAGAVRWARRSTGFQLASPSHAWSRRQPDSHGSGRQVPDICQAVTKLGPNEDCFSWLRALISRY